MFHRLMDYMRGLSDLCHRTPNTAHKSPRSNFGAFTTTIFTKIRLPSHFLLHYMGKEAHWLLSVYDLPFSSCQGRYSLAS